MLLTAALIISLEPYVGIGEGDLTWSIAGDNAGGSPNILSELQFQNLRSQHSGLRGHVLVGPESGSQDFRFRIEGDLNYGRFHDGVSTDSDYAADNRTGLYSLSKSQVSGDQIESFSGGFGIDYQLNGGSHVLGVVFGGFYNEQAVNFHTGRQLVADPDYFNASIEEVNANLRRYLDSDYLAEWSGNWLAGLYQFNPGRWHFQLRGQYYLGSYYGEGRWNLRADGPSALQQPKSFTHNADSDGWQWSLGMGYQMTESLRLGANYLWTDWRTDEGRTKTYFADGVVQLTQFNGAEWGSSQWQLSLQLLF